MMRLASPKGRLYCTRGRSSFLIATLAAAPSVDEVSLAAWIVGVGFIGLEAYFFGALLRAWMNDRRARAGSKSRRVR